MTKILLNTLFMMTTQYYFSVYAQFKNEGINMREWLDHYIWQGAEHFFLIDNDSTDNSKEIIESYGDKITYYFLPEKYAQVKNICNITKELQNKKLTKWVLYCDLDEFLFSVDGNKISDYLRKNESYDSIFVNWFIFGSSGYVKQPPNLRQYFIMRQPNINHHTKMIIQIQNVNAEDIDVHGLRKSAYRRKTENTELHMNHYMIQSEEFFKNIKLTRGDVSGPMWEKVRTNPNYYTDNDKNQTYKDELLKQMVDKINLPII